MSPRNGVGPGVILMTAVLVAGCDSRPEPLGSVSTGIVVEHGASNPTVALGDGTTYIAWVGTEGEESNVFLASAAADRAFEAPVRVNDQPGDAAPHAQAPAQVATGPGDDVYVVWQNNTFIEGRRFPASDLRFARSVDGGRTFGPAIFVNDDAGGRPTSHTFHDMVVAGDGTIYVSWIDGRQRLEEEEAGSQIRIARSTDGGRTFEPSRVVDDEACPCCRTSLAVGRDGEVYVAWRKVYDGSVRDIVLARSLDGGRSFSAPVRVHEDGWVIDACPHAGPAVAADAAGQVHVAWYTGAEGRAGAYYARAGSDLRFGAPVRLSPAGRTPTTQVALSAGPGGATWISWEDVDGADATLRLATVVGQEPPREVDVGAHEAVLPAMDTDSARVVVTWLDGERVHVLGGTRAAR